MFFCPIFALREKFYPRNINHMPPVKPELKLVARLDLDQQPSFMDEHKSVGNTRPGFSSRNDKSAIFDRRLFLFCQMADCLVNPPVSPQH
jgi:hypothetical protein